MEKRNICLTTTQIRRHVNFGNNLQKPKQTNVRFYFVTLKWHGSTCYVNWAILIGDQVDVTTLLLPVLDKTMQNRPQARLTDSLHTWYTERR